MAYSSTAMCRGATMLRYMWSGNSARTASPSPTTRSSTAAFSDWQHCRLKRPKARGCASPKCSKASRLFQPGADRRKILKNNPENRLMDAERPTMRSWKMAWGLVCFLILLSNIWTISHWNESRGVYDDICYLRQAHLFQRFGLDGLNTDIARDDDHYLSSKLKEIGFAQWADPAEAPCHSLMPRTHRRVMQYPPGTGLLLAAFPSGFQAKPLYVLANVIMLGFVLLAIAY